MTIKRRKAYSTKNRDHSARLTTASNPSGVAAEAYRTLRTYLFYTLMEESSKVLVLTSSGSGEGKSTTCANLGIVLAQMHKSTLIVDCDLRKPEIHKFFALPNVWGIGDILIGNQSLQSVLEEPFPDLKVIPGGSIPLDPTELLGSERFKRFLEQMRREFDYVLLDSPPVGSVSDPIILARHADGVLLVLDAQHTRKSSVRRSVRKLQTVGANVIGTVMNNVTVPEGYPRYDYPYDLR